MAYLVAGPLVAIVGIVAVFFVLRRKSVEKRSMYSARREQIQHKVRAARQRTLAGHGHVEKAPEAAPAGPSPFEQTQAQPTVTYQAPVFAPPPAAPPTAPPQRPQVAPASMPWEQPSIPPPAPAAAPESSPWDQPAAAAASAPPTFPPSPVEPYTAAPATIPPPSEPEWTPAPSPAEPAPPREPVAPAASTASAASAGSWSIVSTSKESAEPAPEQPKKKGKKAKVAAADASSWQLASGDAPGVGMQEDEPEVKRVSGTLMAVAQYAVLVVGLVMVLIGVIVMVANSHVT